MSDNTGQTKSPILEKLRKKIPLKTRIYFDLQFDDIDNWENGTYIGDNNKLIKQTESILKIVYKWVDDDCPGHNDMDLSYFKKNQQAVKLKPI